MKDILYTVNNNNCWECYSHCIDRGGYPAISIGGKKVTIYRLQYSLNNGSIPKGMVIRHTCDNPKCINPEHLVIGTHADNVRDRVLRGRSATGERNGRSKLTEEDVAYIYLHIEESDSSLAKKYSIDRKAIYDIRHNKTWISITSKLRK